MAIIRENSIDTIRDDDLLAYGETQKIFDTKPAQQRIKVLSYNIQTGIASNKYHHYVTRSWKHILPHTKRKENLDEIAKVISDYDIVGLQEVDAGSLRSGFINQTQYLARNAGFAHWYDRTNRNFGDFARNSIGILSKFTITDSVDHGLPGFIPGRGALFMQFGSGEDSVVVVVLHLALGKKSRMQQLNFISEKLREYKNILVIGDFNCGWMNEELQYFIEELGLTVPLEEVHTFPSWDPKQHIDHILVTPTLVVENVRVVNCAFSDHLPITAEIILPSGIVLQ